MPIGNEEVHDSAKLHVTGKAIYTDDIKLPVDTLHLAFGTSTIAKGTIKSIDLSDVEKSDGVIAVITAKDLKYKNDTSPSVEDEPLLSDGLIHFLGQPVFLVVAETHIKARKAALLGKITYLEKKPILTINEAITANSTLADGCCIYKKGSPNKKIKSAPVQLADSFYVMHIYANYLLIALVNLHILATVAHHVFFKDKILKKML